MKGRRWDSSGSWLRRVFLESSEAELEGGKYKNFNPLQAFSEASHLKWKGAGHRRYRVGAPVIIVVNGADAGGMDISVSVPNLTEAREVVLVYVTSSHIVGRNYPAIYPFTYQHQT